MANLKASATTSWSWCPWDWGHDSSVARLVDLTVGPTASVNGGAKLKAGTVVDAAVSLTGVVYANARIIGGIRFETRANHIRIEAVGAMVANAGYTVKGTFKMHLFKFEVPLNTFLNLKDDLGGGNVLDPLATLAHHSRW